MGDVQMFVVRVWRRLGLFRAAVQPAEGGPASLFDRAEDLARYLAAGPHAIGLPDADDTPSTDPPRSGGTQPGEA